MLKIVNDKEREEKVVFVDGEFQCFVSYDLEENKILKEIQSLYDFINDEDRFNIIAEDYIDKLLENGIGFETLNENDFREYYLLPIYNKINSDIVAALNIDGNYDNEKLYEDNLAYEAYKELLHLQERIIHILTK